MKNLILSLLLLCFARVSTAQIIVRGVAPESIAYNFEFTWADPAGGDWTTPDFNIPNTFVEAPIILADDGSPGVNAQGNPISAEACAGAPVAGAPPASSGWNDLTGKIAIIYRNTCEFGYKALQAQNAGAVGVIIVNRDPEVIEMAGGAEGLNVTIPVVMLSSVDGATLTNEMANGEVVMFMGNKVNMFENDGGSFEEFVLSPRYGSIPLIMANNNYSFQVGIEVINFGSVDNTFNVNASIDGPSGNIYNETVTSFISAGDTLSIFNGNPSEFPLVSTPTWYGGDYTLTYTISIEGQTDESDFDNVFVRNFSVTSDVLSLAGQENGALKANSFPSNATSSYQTCMQLQDNYPTGTSLTGVNFVAQASDSILQDEEIIIEVFEWNDAWTDVSAGWANVTFDNLNLVVEGLYYPASNDENGQEVTFSLDFELPLVDNQRYLACLTTYNPNISFGYDNSLYYDANYSIYLQPISPLNIDGTQWYSGWSGVSALSMGLVLENCPEPLNISNEQENNCLEQDANGSASVTLTSGSGDYSYFWIDNSGTNLGFSSSVSNLSNGTYTVLISDNANDCIASETFEIVSTDMSESIAYSSCAEEDEGMISFDINHADGGSYPPYTIVLNNGDEATLTSSSGSAFNLEVGSYTYQITDGNSCIYNGDSAVEVGSEINFGVEIEADNISGPSPLTVTFANNTPNASNYNFTWFFGDGTSEINNEPSVNHTYQTEGIWDVLVIAEDILTSCSDTLFLDTLISSGIVNQIELGEETLSIYPNPTRGNVMISASSALTNGYVIYDQQGRVVLSGTLKGKYTSISLERLSRGSYTIKVEGNYKPMMLIKD